MSNPPPNPSLQICFAGDDESRRDTGESSSGAPPNHHNEENRQEDGAPDPSPTRYEPSLADVLVLKAMLNEARRLPLELVDAIVDLAEYWPHTRVARDFRGTSGSDSLVTPSRYSGENNRFLLRTPPLGFTRPPAGTDDEAAAYETTPPAPRPAGKLCSDDDVRRWLEEAGPDGKAHGRVPGLEHPCRKIVFKFVSRDQGWSSRRRHKAGHAFRGAYSWFDVGLERYAAADEGEGDATEEAEEPAPPANKRAAVVAPVAGAAAAAPGTAPPQELTAPPKDDTTATTTTSSSSSSSTAHRHTGAPPLSALRSIIPPVKQIDVPPARTFHPDSVAATPAAESTDTQNAFAFPLLPGPDKLQANRVADREWQAYEIVWSWTDAPPVAEQQEQEGGDHHNTPEDKEHPDGGNGEDDDEDSEESDNDPLERIGRGALTGDGRFVRSLRVGDVVTVWAKARFPGWVNMVQQVAVEVYWAV